jgi:hypothetical protein
VREILAYDANSRDELHYRAPTNTYWGAGISPHPTAWHRRNLSQAMEHAERVPHAEFGAFLRAISNTIILPGLLRTMGRDGPVAILAVREFAK